MHREIQIKQFPIVTTHWWPKTRNERFVWEKWSECAHSSGVWRVCARTLAHAAFTRGVGVNAWRRACLKRGADCWRAVIVTTTNHILLWCCMNGIGYLHEAIWLAEPLVSCLRPSMCCYDGELFNLDFSVHVLFPSYRDSDLYLPLYDWQTRMVWPKNIKIGSTEEKKTPTSWGKLIDTKF